MWKLGEWGEDHNQSRTTKQVEPTRGRCIGRDHKRRDTGSCIDPWSAKPSTLDWLRRPWTWGEPPESPEKPCPSESWS